MAKGTISMKRFKGNLTKISKLAKTGYNSITSVAKQIIDTVTNMASKISILGENAVWYPNQQLTSVSNYQSYYDEMNKIEAQFLNNSLNNLENYKNGVIFDIYRVGDAVSQNTDALSPMLTETIRNAFGNAATDFFECGEKSGNSFGNGFKVSIEKSMQEIRGIVLATMGSISPVITSIRTGASASGVVNYNNPSYNFYGSNQTVTQQLNEARKAAAISKLRGN